MVEFAKDEQRRLFSGWGTISVVDRQNDYIDVLKEFRDAGVMEKMMKRGAPVIDSHTNHVVGRIVSFQYAIAPSGNPGLYLTAEIHKDYPSDDEVWEKIKEGAYTGFSLGGKASDKQPVCNDMGCHNNLTGIESWEWSIVNTPANQEALIDNVNKLAKSLKFSKEDAKRIGNKLKIDWNKINIDEFTTGLNIELEHGTKNSETNITDNNEEMTAKIALAHLNEFTDYYSKSRGLPKLETQLSKEIEVDKGIKSFLVNVGRGIGSFLDNLSDYEIDEWVETHWKPFSRIDSGWNERIKEMWRNKDKEYSRKYKIYKARVYIKNPSEAPQGVKVQEGERGGHYYETSESSEQPETKPQRTTTNNIEIITGEITDNRILDSLEMFAEEGDIEAVSPPSKEDVERQVKMSGVKNRKIIFIPYSCETVNAYTYLGEDVIHLMCNNAETDKDIIEETVTKLYKNGYSLKGLTWENRRIGSIVHEEGHIRTYELCEIKSVNENWVGKLHYKFNTYEKYILKYLESDDNSIAGETLLELLAEDYRINNRYGNAFPHRYFFDKDIKDNDFKEQRAYLLRKAGLF